MKKLCVGLVLALELAWACGCKNTNAYRGSGRSSEAVFPVAPGAGEQVPARVMPPPPASPTSAAAPSAP